MKSINLFTLIVLCVSQLHSASTAGTIDPFESFPDAKPVVLIIKDIDPEVCKRQFDAFHEAKNLKEKKLQNMKWLNTMLQAYSGLHKAQLVVVHFMIFKTGSADLLMGQQGVAHNQEEYFVLAWKMPQNYLNSVVTR